MSTKQPEQKLIINSSSLLSTLHSPWALPLASSLLPPLCPAMPLSWLRVLVYDWVTLLYCLWSFLSRSIFHQFRLISLYLYGLASVIQCLFQFCLIVTISPFLFSPSPDSFILSHSPSIFFLLLQSFIYSVSARFFPNLTHSFSLIVWHSRKKRSFPPSFLN